MMSQRKNVRKTGKQQRRGPRPSARDNALVLRPEYAGQPVLLLKLFKSLGTQTTTVTTGVITTNNGLAATDINQFSTRFAGWSEYRLVKVKAMFRAFSSTATGVINMWFSEDDSGAPTSNKAQNIVCKRFNASDVSKVHSLTYVPHDPAQQTWSLVSGASVNVGYFKLYTDSAIYGSPIAVTALGSVDYEYHVQFRGLI